MKGIRYITGLFFIAATILIINSCNKNNEPLVYNSELVFTNSFKINVEPYSYTNADSTEVYWVYGDSALVADTVSSTPVFQWSNVFTGLITIVVSKKAFIVSDNNIVNADQIIWQWQPGIEKGELGKVAYMEGKPVKIGKILYDTQPLPLESGLYYWAVWSWESSGREIVYSTIPLKMFVK